MALKWNYKFIGKSLLAVSPATFYRLPPPLRLKHTQLVFIVLQCLTISLPLLIGLRDTKEPHSVIHRGWVKSGAQLQSRKCYYAILLILALLRARAAVCPHDIISTRILRTNPDSRVKCVSLAQIVFIHRFVGFTFTAAFAFVSFPFGTKGRVPSSPTPPPPLLPIR